jgi:hypothetical protein
MSKLALRSTVLYTALFLCGTGQATSLIVDANGILAGAIGVPVGGMLYNVEFVDGTCADAYDLCDTDHFAFTSASAALAASKALLDYVLLDVPGLGDFDSNPTLTHGCTLPQNTAGNCWLLTPYSILGNNFLITQTANIDLNQNDGYFVHTGDPNSPGISISGYDGSEDINGVLARWVAVPEPPTMALLGLGLFAMFFKAIRRNRL